MKYSQLTDEQKKQVLLVTGGEIPNETYKIQMEMPNTSVVFGTPYPHGAGWRAEDGPSFKQDEQEIEGVLTLCGNRCAFCGLSLPDGPETNICEECFTDGAGTF